MTSKAPLSHQIKVGLFVAAGAILVSISLFLVGGEGFVKSHVILHAKFDSVQGLNEGSVVSLSGIRVGNIQKFVFLPEENKLDVWMKVEADYLSRITEGSSVEIRTQGALGDKYIYINPGPQSARPLKNGDSVEVLKANDIMAVLSEKGNEASKIFDIIKEIDKFAKNLNEENRAEKIMTNLAATTTELRIAAKDSRELISELKDQNTSNKISSSVDKLDRILSKIDRGEGTLGALINDNSLHESLKAMVGAPDKKKTIKSLIRSSIEKSEKE
jgi:phospholipid/cholesterol/gamma-HCH transport system substrate-binding protein